MGLLYEALDSHLRRIRLIDRRINDAQTCFCLPLSLSLSLFLLLSLALLLSLFLNGTAAETDVYARCRDITVIYPLTRVTWLNDRIIEDTLCVAGNGEHLA